MALHLFRKSKTLSFERTYDAPVDRVWAAWTEPDLLRRWWSPKDTSVTDCTVDLRVGGTVHIVMEAGAGMGKYAGTRWPMLGTFTEITEPDLLVYEARSWTEGEEEATTIEHTTTVRFTSSADKTTVALEVAITKIGPKAKMAAFGMKFGYKAYLDNLADVLA